MLMFTPAADGGDILHLGGIVGHNGRSTAGQHHVGAVVHGNVVGNIMNEGAFGADIGKLLCKHGVPRQERLLCMERRAPECCRLYTSTPAMTAPTAVEMRKGTM